MADQKGHIDIDHTIPYIVHEGAMARNERTVKRLIIALIICTFFLVMSNMAWLYAWCQYDYESEQTTTSTTTIDGGEDGVANYIGNDGDIINGENSSDNESPTQEKKTEKERKK